MACGLISGHKKERKTVLKKVTLKNIGLPTWGETEWPRFVSKKTYSALYTVYPDLSKQIIYVLGLCKYLSSEWQKMLLAVRFFVVIASHFQAILLSTLSTLT